MTGIHTPGLNNRIRQADADYAIRLAARQARQAQIAETAGFHEGQGQQFPAHNGSKRVRQARTAKRRR